MDYENDVKASTGAFELAYKGMALKTSNVPTSTNKAVPSEISKALLPTSSIGAKKWKPNAANVIKDIGYGMRQTLEDLLMILKREKQKKENTKNQSIPTIASLLAPKIHQSVETVTSIACIETQTLNNIKIIEINSKDDLISTYQKNGRQRLENSETNTIKYTKEYILNLFKKRDNDDKIET